MIAATDLRIGNVLISDKELISVVEIHTVNFYCECIGGLTYNYNSCVILPIKLTPEILELVGFDNNKTHFTHWINDDNPFIIMQNKKGNYCLCDCDVDSDMEYLHELQNMYKCFTKQELPIDINTLKV